MNTQPTASTNPYQQRLTKGFNWLGGATIIARVVDSATILVMLLFLSKHQVGVASMVLSAGMIIEAFNGLGTSEALIQAHTVTRSQLDTLFWYILGAALLVGAVTLLAAPWIAVIFGSPGMAIFFLALAIKQPVVGAALIPLALLNRDLRYERIATVNVCATLAAAVTRLALGALGAGTWALVAGYAASGVYILIGATIARPFLPQLHFRLSSIAPLIRFGARAATANVAEQMFKNVDYLLIGWMYGATPLAIYRVAFDIAMEPAMAVATLVNRTALPIFMRVAAAQGQLADILTWSLRKVTTLVAPIMTGLIIGAAPLTALIRDQQGRTYAAAALPLMLLAAAAVLRVMSQLLPTVMLVSNKPGLAARLSLTIFSLLAVGILIVGHYLPAQRGIVAIAALWLGIYPALLAWGYSYLHRHWSLRAVDLARCLAAPLAAVGAMAVLVLSVRRLTGLMDPRAQIAMVAIAVLLTYAGLFLYGRRETRDAVAL
jgi:O-antigen/teichoic acid export membrane protein